jgi:hypothetical protein
MNPTTPDPQDPNPAPRGAQHGLPHDPPPVGVWQGSSSELNALLSGALSGYRAGVLDTRPLIIVGHASAPAPAVQPAAGHIPAPAPPPALGPVDARGRGHRCGRFSEAQALMFCGTAAGTTALGAALATGSHPVLAAAAILTGLTVLPAGVVFRAAQHDERH